MGQSHSTVKVADVLRDNRILLINLKGVSKDTAQLAGTLMMNAIWHAVKTVKKVKPTYIILDEFADFMDLPIDTESMLAQARKHKVGMVLANQHMAQLKPSVRDAVITNARSKVVFQTNADDGRVVGREMGQHLEPSDFTNLRAHEAIVRVQTKDASSPPISIRTAPPTKASGYANAAISASRQTYSRNLADVKVEIENRHKIKPNGPQTRKPNIGGDGQWGLQ
jgi:type IV secretory pathway TraG/TraD family ATPase VirD4